MIENVGQHALGNLGQSSNGENMHLGDFISLMTRANICPNEKWGGGGMREIRRSYESRMKGAIGDIVFGMY